MIENMEDEEYVPENCDLRTYLNSLNLNDIHTENIVKQQIFDSPVFSKPKIKSKENVEYIDGDIIEQIEELMAARMIFEEDVTNIEKLLSNFKVVKTGMLRSIFENVSGFIIIVLGLCVYWIIGSYVFFLISFYYAYNAADYLWKKHFNQRRLKYLVNVLTDNYILFKKALKFINDSDNILKFDNADSLEYQINLRGECELYLNLKKDFVEVEKEMIFVLTKATKTLINKFPFHDYVENPHYYLCNRYEQYFLNCLDIKKLYQIYLLVQSEFLQRLALSLIPNLKVSGKTKSFELFKIIKETTFTLRQLEYTFGKKFKFVFLRGIFCSDEKFSLTASKKTISLPVNPYKNEFIMNIQDMSNAFQRLLIRSRTLEDNLSNDNCSEKMENELSDIQSELNVCQRSISDSFIVLKKLSGKSDSTNIQELPQKIDEDRIVEPKLKIDLTSEDVHVENDVYEAYFTSDTGNENEENDDYDIDDYMKKKMERDYSKLVLEELKTKIAEKAKVRSVWEANICKKKHYNTYEEDTSEYKAVNESKNCLSKLNTDVDHDQLAHDHPCVNFEQNGSVAEQSSAENDCKSINSLSFGFPSSNFLKSIFEAREKLMKAPLVEEHFCDGGED